MKRFAQVNSDGFVTKIFISDKDSEPGCVEIPHNLELRFDVHKIKHLGGGRFQTTGETWIPKPTPSLARSQQYPSVGDQLDAIWKALAPLVEHPEALAMIEKIKAVKAANPKT